MWALLRHRGDRRALRAFDERLELVKAGLTRRDLVRMGLLTGGGLGGGLLVSEKGLAQGSRRPDALGPLPPLEPFVEPLTVLPVLDDRAEAELSPAATASPNRDANPATGLPYEGRSEPHQSRETFPPRAFHVTRMGANPACMIHPALPAQTLWGFNRGGADLAQDPPMAPGPVLVLR